MVVAKAFLSRYTSSVAVASRTLNSAHPSGCTTSHSCSLQSSRSHRFTGTWTGIALTPDLTGTIQAQLTLKTLVSWLYKHGYSTTVLKDEFCCADGQLESLWPRAWGSILLQSWCVIKAATSAASHLASIWLAVSNEDIPLPFAIAGLLCV